MDEFSEESLLRKIDRRIREMQKDTQSGRSKIERLIVDDSIKTVAEFATFAMTKIDQINLMYDYLVDEDDRIYDKSITKCVLFDYIKDKEILEKEISGEILYQFENDNFIVSTVEGDFLMFKLLCIGQHYLFVKTGLINLNE